MNRIVASVAKLQLKIYTFYTYDLALSRWYGKTVEYDR